MVKIPAARLEELAATYGLSVRTLYRYKLAGIDVTDPLQVVAHMVTSTWNTDLSRVVKTLSDQTTTTTNELHDQTN